MNLIQYLKETRAELRHVSWPSRRETTVFTAVVIAVSLATALYLGFFDYLFSLALLLFIS